MERKDIKANLKLVLSKDRYKHTIGVAYTAQCLAMKYSVDLQLADMAGLLHDCGKIMPDNEKLSECEKLGIDINEAEKLNPSLLHSKLGAYYAKNKYGICNEQIINAILYHTTGRPDMTILEKIIFVADYIEPHRDKAPNLDTIRRISFENIDKAVFLICQDTVNYVIECKQVLDEMTVRTMKFYEQFK